MYAWEAYPALFWLAMPPIVGITATVGVQWRRSRYWAAAALLNVIPAAGICLRIVAAGGFGVVSHDPTFGLARNSILLAGFHAVPIAIVFAQSLWLSRVQTRGEVAVFGGVTYSVLNIAVGVLFTMAGLFLG